MDRFLQELVLNSAHPPDEDAVNKLLQGIDSWSFDIFQIEDDDLPKAGTPHPLLTTFVEEHLISHFNPQTCGGLAVMLG